MSVTLSIKNAPDRIVERLKERASRNHRSLQGELMAIIERAAEEVSAPPSVAEAYAAVRALGFSMPSEATAIVREDRDR